jgi:hypothetical protein
MPTWKAMLPYAPTWSAVEGSSESTHAGAMMPPITICTTLRRGGVGRHAARNVTSTTAKIAALNPSQVAAASRSSGKISRFKSPPLAWAGAALSAMHSTTAAAASGAAARVRFSS